MRKRETPAGVTRRAFSFACDDRASVSRRRAGSAAVPKRALRSSAAAAWARHPWLRCESPFAGRGLPRFPLVGCPSFGVFAPPMSRSDGRSAHWPTHFGTGRLGLESPLLARKKWHLKDEVRGYRHGAATSCGLSTPVERRRSTGATQRAGMIDAATKPTTCLGRTGNFVSQQARVQPRPDGWAGSPAATHLAS